ncbi:hypothetical protein Ae406Ps2_1101 [Pseudonocardia sp. Ae406_Ps2]|nr:hypothetical protein Ae406Ps2_1101 [Pseudonocardia sp. Ae406_Ps2]OLM07104.1 hypothetical protein Ae331Ps2_4814c [Pseudonocardia sp. Ae331_Ps2]OLM22679.1 hypothetical protein Ae706Ps2_1111 [Pseudonocardia sp. Ae706_Ps2]
MVGNGSPEVAARWDKLTVPPASAIASSRSTARSTDCTLPERAGAAAATSAAAPTRLSGSFFRMTEV